jgi:hypothetical protein
MTRRPKANPVIRKAATLTPFRQGQFDTLCALYAAFNAVQLVRPLSMAKAQTLFSQTIAYIRNDFPHLNPVTQGLSCKRMIAVVECVARLAQTKRIEMETVLPGKTELAPWIDQRLAEGVPIIACLIPWSHFTVVSAISKAGLTLFDSQGMSWVPLQKNEPLDDLLDRDGLIGLRATSTITMMRD